MSGIICPKCGRDSSAVRFIGAFCIYCYPVRFEAPAKLELKRCKNCDLMHLRGEWVPYSEKKIGAYIVSKCKGEFTHAEYDFARQVVKAVLEKDGDVIGIERPVRLDVTITTCPRCSRISGGYYEAIIQLRGDRKKCEKQAAMILKRLVKKTFISKTEEKEEGIDIYVGDSKAVVGLMGELGVRALITKKLVGRDEGKTLYRTTFLVRF